MYFGFSLALAYRTYKKGSFLVFNGWRAFQSSFLSLKGSMDIEWRNDIRRCPRGTPPVSPLDVQWERADGPQTSGWGLSHSKVRSQNCSSHHMPPWLSRKWQNGLERTHLGSMHRHRRHQTIRHRLGRDYHHFRITIGPPESPRHESFPPSPAHNICTQYPTWRRSP